MCLNKLIRSGRKGISPYYKYQKKYGYKVLFENKPGFLTGMHRGLDGSSSDRKQPITLGREYESTNGRICINYNNKGHRITHEAGFHIYSTLKDAKDENYYSKTVVVKVEYKDPVALGIDNGKLTIIAKKIKFLNVIR